MKNSKLALGVSVLAAAAFLSPAPAHADIMGTAYFATQEQAQDADIGATLGLPVEATFTVPQPNAGCTGAFIGNTLCFSSFGTGINGGNPTAAYTLGAFLATGGATVASGSTSLGNPLAFSEGTTGTSTGTLFEFTGTVSVTTNQVFTANHSEGMTLWIDTPEFAVIGAPTSAGITSGVYTGPSGNLPFDLIYGACCGAEALLAITLPLASGVGGPPPVPEPASLAILGAALIGFGAVRRRNKSV